MTMDWIEDDRDIRHNISSSKSETVIIEPLGNILKEFFKTEDVWKDYEYKNEKKKGKQLQDIILPKTNINVPKAKPIENQQIEHETLQEELNNEILDKEIYKKCWYS